MELQMNFFTKILRNSIFIFFGFLSAQVYAQVCSIPTSLKNKDQIQISIYFGYIDQRPDNFTLDPKHSQDLLKLMSSPCTNSNQVVCGFSLIQDFEKNRYLLEKYFMGKNFQIQLISSSISENDDLNSKSSEQFQVSSRNFDLFSRSLQKDDVVLYQGHSRYGYGPDFLNPVLDENGFTNKEFYSMSGFKTRSVLTTVLNERRDRLPVLGMFSCDSDKHFSGMLRSLKKTDFLMLTRDITYSSQLQKPMLQFLHNLLLGQCLSQGIEGFKFY